MIVYDKEKKELIIPDGLGNANIPCGGSSYEEGYADGQADQKSKLVVTAVTENGVYERLDGFKKITVEVPVEAQLQSKSVELVSKSTIIRPDSGFDGMTEVEINAVPVYNTGYDEGAQDQKALLVATAITANGTYSTENGYGEVVVNVPQGSIENVENEYLYERDYVELDYDFANDYFENAAVYAVGACSCVRKGNFIGRNLDWLYDNEVNVVVRTAKGNGLKSTLGVAGGLASLTIDQIESGLTYEQDKILPFYLQDGFNSDGLFAAINIVPSNGNIQTEGDERICAISLVRYILDHYATVKEVVEGLENKQIFFPRALLDMNYEAHWLIADAHRTVVLEIINNKLEVIDNQEIVTNFHLYGVVFNPDGGVYTNTTAMQGRYPRMNNIEDYGLGLERYNFLNSNNAYTKEDIEMLMDGVKYSRAYTDIPVWYSEFVGAGITVNTPANNPEFQDRIEIYRAKWANKDRNEPEVWLTTHSAIYDLENRVLWVKSQEHNGENIYRLLNTAELEEKSAELDTITGTILPSEGYDGFTSVEYDATSIYESGFTSGHTEGYEEGYESGSSIGYEEGYTEGYTSGETHQKSLLASTAFTENGDYAAENGWSAVTVNVNLEEPYREGLEAGYASGFTAGIEDQKSRLTDINIAKNGSYSREDGYKNVVVDIPFEEKEYIVESYYTDPNPVIVPSSGYEGMSKVTVDISKVYQEGVEMGEASGKTEGYQSGYTAGKTDGLAEQKAKLISTTITENGNYAREDGWNDVTVNVPQTFIETMTQAQYDALVTKRDDTIYLITCV